MSDRKLSLALFAADEVGDRVARCIRDRGESVACLVLDREDSRAWNHRIRETMSDHAGAILTDDVLSESDLAHVDLAILAWWPRIIPTTWLTATRFGFLNFHPSLLPHNRGKHYNFWAIVEGAPFGVTIHWADERVDAGDIAFQSRLEVTWEDTGATLYHRAQKAIVDLFDASYDRIVRGDIPRIPQDLSLGSFHRAAELEEASRIDLDRTYAARDLLNLLRARTFPGHPGAFFFDGRKRYEIRVSIEKTGE